MPRGVGSFYILSHPAYFRKFVNECVYSMCKYESTLARLNSDMGRRRIFYMSPASHWDNISLKRLSCRDWTWEM